MKNRDMKNELKINYQCPECLSYLRVWNNIIFTVKSSNKNKQGILLLNPELGNYSIISHPALRFVPGEKVDFICPVCQFDLTAKEINDKLVKIFMVDEKNNKFDIFFSKIAGEHSTFKIEKDTIVEKHGEHNSSYMNYFLGKWEKRKTIIKRN